MAVKKDACKFEQNLTMTHKDIVAKRAKELKDDTQFAQEEIIRQLVVKKRGYERELAQLEDLYPDHTTSLTFQKNFKPTEWVAEVQSLKTKIRLVDEELTQAEQTMKEWFSV